jgi:predicted ATPase
MRITHLKIRNFRGISVAQIQDAGSAVVIAGPNGSGKTCVLDSIRLFKSAYGSYAQSELDLWSNEFQLSWRGVPGDFRGLLRNRDREMRIAAQVEISERERSYLLGDGRWMTLELAWKQLYPTVQTRRGRLAGVANTEHLKKAQHVHSHATTLQRQLTEELKWRSAQGVLTVRPDGQATRQDSLALQLLFGFFIPDHIGIIDYHGSHRKYAREQLRHIALQESDEEEKVKTGALYNYETKYANLKSAMAGEYVRELLERDASGKKTGKAKPLSATLQELFQLFLPDKTFKGPQAVEGGEVAFRVWVDDTTYHDINELSSGEKEILFAYLRARTLSPRQSVLLIDEPELHLNPGLVQGLPQFYERHIGRDLDNQIWLVTHSDRFLREALEAAGMSVYHMQHASAVGAGSNQLQMIDTKASIQALFIDLVGDLAAYQPGGKVVILEGANSKFDEKTVRRLFPSIAKSINFISGGSKANVRKLHETVDAMISGGLAPVEVLSIVDPDSDIWSREIREKGNRLEWTVYHIENYLLDVTYIKRALDVVKLEGAGRLTSGQIEKRLEDAAEDLIETLALERVRGQLRRKLRKAIEIRVDSGGRADRQLADSVGAAATAVNAIGAEYSIALTEVEMKKAEQEFRAMWSDGMWREKFPGRQILNGLCKKLGGNVQYIVLRNAIVGEMAKDGHQPDGMVTVMRRVAEA